MKTDEQLKCKDCDWYGSCEYYGRRKETSQICKMFNNTWKFVKELEKIRCEIRDKGMVTNYTYITEDGKVLQRSIVDVVIDKHIAELKGENK